MAWAWGEPVRVTGTDGAFSWSGTIHAIFRTNETSYPNVTDGTVAPPTGFIGVAVSAFGCFAELVRVDSYEEAIGGGQMYAQIDYRFRVGWGVGMEGETFESDIIRLTATYGPGYPLVWTGITEISAGYTFSTAGMLVKRRFGVNVPASRLHMTPLDAGVHDVWAATPGYNPQVSCYGLSAGYVRRDLAAYAGMTDPEIGDDTGVGDPSIGLALTQKGGGDWTPEGVAFASVSVSGADFSGLDATFVGGNSGTDQHDVRARGSGDTITGYAIAPAGASVFNNTWSGVQYGSMIYDFDAEAHLWADILVDPEVSFGFVDESGNPLVTTLSELPTSADGEPGLFACSGHIYHGAPSYSVHNNSQEFVGQIDEEWAVRHYLCPDPVSTVLERALLFRVPGVAQLSGDYQPTVLTVTAAPETPLLPLVAHYDEEGELVPRWTLTGGLTEAADSTLASPKFTIDHTGGTATYHPRTRYWDRLALLPQLDVEKDWDWPKDFKADAAGENVGGESLDLPGYAEDVYHWGASTYLKITFDRDPGLELTLSLVVRYSLVTVTDPHYTCGGPRAEEWEYERTTEEATYSATLAAGEDTVVFDLLCPIEGTLPRLLIVDDVVFGFQHDSDFPEDITITDFALVEDQGYDHTGRQGETPAPKLEASVKCPGDYQADWQGMSLFRDGALHVLNVPDEPGRGGTPERGYGSVEPAEHCPDSTAEGQIDQARGLVDLGYPAFIEGLSVTTHQAVLDELFKNFWKGDDDPEVLTDGMFYFGADRLEQTDEATAPLACAVLVRHWRIVRGLPYTFRVEKQIGAAFHGVTKTPSGQRRVRVNDDNAVGHTLQVLRRVHSFTLPTGIGTAPVDGDWEQVVLGSLDAFLDEHGVLSVTDLWPSSSRYWHPDVANVANQDGTVTIRHHYFLWPTQGSPWTEYNPAEDYDAMVSDPRLVADGDVGTLAARRWTILPLEVPELARGVDVAATPWGSWMVVHDPRYLFPAQTPPIPPVGMLVDTVDTDAAPGGVPRYSLHNSAYSPRAIAPPPAYENCFAVVRLEDTTIAVVRSDTLGRDLTTVLAIPDYTTADLTYNARFGAWFLVGRKADGHLWCGRVSALRGAGTAFDELYDFGSCDPVGGAIAANPQGVLAVVLVLDETLHFYTSEDAGRTWVEVTDGA